MRAPRARLNARFADSKERLEDAEDAIRGVSERRLAELMKSPERERFNHIDDRDLTPADRAKLRRSIAASLGHTKTDVVLLSSNILLLRISRWLRRRVANAMGAAAISVVAVAAVGLPIAIAWSNTDEVITLPQLVEFNWRLPSGAIEPKAFPAGARLAISRQADSISLARRWVAGTGYATAAVKIVSHLQ